MAAPEDPAFAAATMLVVASTPPRPDTGAELGAVVLRYSGFGYMPVSDLHCALDAHTDPATTLRRSGLRPDQVLGRPPAAVALAYLDSWLTRPPYLLVTHGPVLREQIETHRDSCPTLADLTLLDTGLLARHLHPGPHLRLNQWASRLGARPLAANTSLEARLVAGLFTRLMGELLRRPDPADLAALIQIAAPPPPDAPAARPAGALPRPSSAARERNAAWTPSWA